MNIAIVGAGILTKEEALNARLIIDKILNDNMSATLVSGGSKGIDTIAEDVAKSMEIKTQIFSPETEKWEPNDGSIGYKARNLQIVEACDILYCFPAGLRDRRCYHCDADHQVGGGCWTMWQARRLGKETKIILPPNI